MHANPVFPATALCRCRDDEDFKEFADFVDDDAVVETRKRRAGVGRSRRLVRLCVPPLTPVPLLLTRSRVLRPLHASPSRRSTC